jgi:hypothetical protein
VRVHRIETEQVILQRVPTLIGVGTHF